MDNQLTPAARANGGGRPDNARGPALRDGNGHPPAGGDHDRIDLNVPAPAKRRIVIVSIIGAVVLVVMLVVGLLPRFHTNAQLAIDAQAALNAPIPVTLVKARKAAGTIPVVLPATLRPWAEASLYSRATGYLEKNYVDIYSVVDEGEWMADISAPDVDQQLLASRATLVFQKAAADKARTDLAFAKKVNERYQSLKETSGVTQVELDQYEANFNSAAAIFKQSTAQVGVAEANVEQLEVMKSFQKIVAPFRGVVTGRAYDPGAFILANPTTTDILPLFKIAKIDVIRAFIQVPQSYALTIKQGQKVTFKAREVPNREFTGEVLGTTNYLDVSARSLLTEIRLENDKLELLPGMYCEATLQIARLSPPLLIPAAALVINASGKQVAVVQDGKVHFKPVNLGVDNGNEIEIVGGLTVDDQIIGNPGERTVEGAPVQVGGDKKGAAQE
jgi:RND family efflux transporter MFP subunit